jgi:hypothetical protein
MLTYEGETGCPGHLEAASKESVKVDQHCQAFFPAKESGVLWFKKVDMANGRNGNHGDVSRRI